MQAGEEGQRRVGQQGVLSLGTTRQGDAGQCGRGVACASRTADDVGGSERRGRLTIRPGTRI